MASKHKNLFLFDLDGTLISTGGAGLRALSETFKELYGLEGILSAIDPSGKTDPAIFREIIRVFLKRDAKPGEIEQAAAVYLSHLERESLDSSRLTVLPGVEFFLHHLAHQPDVMFGLGTGNLEKGARTKLEPTGLNSYFKFGGFGSDAEDRAELLQIGHSRAEEFGGEKIHSQSVYVLGDTILDVAAARRAGYQAVSVATGRTPYEELKESQPDFILRDLTEGLQFLSWVLSSGVVYA